MKSNLFVSAFVGMSVLFAACSSDDEERVSGGVTEDAGFVADVAGVAQKGPFVKGSAVTVRGIDCKTLEFTDQVFEGAIKSDKGDFALDSVALDTSCAVVEVTGRYLNEVTGKKTKGELTLRALTDLKDRENVNVNLLTNLEYERVMYLVKEKNKTLAKAKTQAESEVLAAFDIKDEVDEFENLNIFESGDGNAALLAVSVIMQGDADETALAKRLDNFDDSFAESGEWKDSETKKAIAEWVAEASANGKLDSIRKNIEGLDYADEIPAFEKYIPAVEPADSIEEESSSSAVEESSSSDVIASEAKQSSSSEKQDARDSVVTSSSSEVKADTVSSSSVVPPVSSSSRDSLETLISSSSSIPDSLDSLRSSSSDVDTSVSVSRFDWNLPKSAYLSPNIKYDSIVDSRDGNVYKTVKIGDQTWMAENLNYATKDSWCYGNDDAHCDVMGRLYPWMSVIDMASLTDADSLHRHGICPAGWHVPDYDEWDTLFAAVGGQDVAGLALKASAGWLNGGNGSNSFGFTILPAGIGQYETNFGHVGESTIFWTSLRYGSIAAYHIFIDDDDDDVSFGTSPKEDYHSVRCLKD